MKLHCNPAIYFIYPEVNFFEIDHPATATAKRCGIEKIGQAANLLLVPADLAKTKLSELLTENKTWQINKTSVVIMEGLLYYLPASDVLDLFSELAEVCTERSRVVFSHMFDHLQYPLVLPLLRLIGEPWLSSAKVDELPGYIGPGWNLSITQTVTAGKQFEGLAMAEKITQTGN